MPLRQLLKGACLGEVSSHRSSGGFALTSKGMDEYPYQQHCNAVCPVICVCEEILRILTITDDYHKQLAERQQSGRRLHLAMEKNTEKDLH